jgi:erythronate-4-phosphate dehydrogenase
LRIFADENISGAAEAFEPFGTVVTVDGRSIGREMLVDADVLLVRSVTRVDAELVEGTHLKFVGTATAGTDHIDLEALRERGIHVVHAPGSNAPSVGDYVIGAMLHLAVAEERSIAGLTCAVIGCGAVGGRLAARLESLGLRVLRVDPPLHDRMTGLGQTTSFVDADEAIASADIVTLHVPLHNIAPYSTFDLMDGTRLDLMQKDAWLINTSRGRVVDECALADWLARSPDARAVIDVWSNEPLPDCDLIRRSAIATPHIAGYAFEGKLRATEMLRKSLADWLRAEIPGPVDRSTPLVLAAPPVESTKPEEWLHRVATSVYDLARDDAGLRNACSRPTRSGMNFVDTVSTEAPFRRRYTRQLPRVWR